MNTTASLLEQLIECGTPAHLVAEVARLEARAEFLRNELIFIRAELEEERKGGDQ